MRLENETANTSQHQIFGQFKGERRMSKKENSSVRQPVLLSRSPQPDLPIILLHDNAAYSRTDQKTIYSMPSPPPQPQGQQNTPENTYLLLTSIPSTQVEQFFLGYLPNQSSGISMKELLKNATVKIKHYKGAIYCGCLVNGQRHGLGIILYKNGRKYEGEWQTDMKYGRGYQQFQNGSTFQGFYVNGKPTGVGIYRWLSGEVYEGQWYNGLKHGSGLWKGPKGESYVGQWRYGKANGYGVHMWLNGDRYEGQFKDCLKHGEGTQKFNNGDSFTGNYVEGRPEGQGHYVWADGSQFKGQFKAGMRQGKGTWTNKKGHIYQGQYKEDRKSGYGVFRWPNGNLYKGQFQEDVRHGHGEMFWIDGTLYKGLWNKGKQQGQGQLRLPNQAIKKGYFQCSIIQEQKNQTPLEKDHQHIPHQNLQQVRLNTNEADQDQFNDQDSSFKDIIRAGIVTPTTRHIMITPRNEHLPQPQHHRRRRDKFNKVLRVQNPLLKQGRAFSCQSKRNNLQRISQQSRLTRRIQTSNRARYFQSSQLSTRPAVASHNSNNHPIPNNPNNSHQKSFILWQ